MLYPIGAKMWSVYRHQQVVSSYEQQVLGKEMNWQCETLWQQAMQYEEKGSNCGISYEQTLSVNGSDVMGTLVIPEIDVNLPIYHGTADEVLQKGVGHLQKSDLPIGGKGKHCVLTGHRGLPSARLFTRLDELKQGDKLYLKVLNQTMAYEVSAVYPMVPKEHLEEINDITAPRSGEDLVTLITCTPYGVNTHRLLVQASRVKYQGELEQAKDQITQEKPEVPKWILGVFAVMAAVVIGGVYSVKKIGVLLLCGLLMAGLWTGYGKAAEAAKPDAGCSLTISAEKQSVEIPISVFCIATWDEDGAYYISPDFKNAGVDKLNGDLTTENLRQVTELLKRQAGKVTPLAKTTVKDGRCVLEHLATGIYLVVPDSVSDAGGRGTYQFSPSLVALPQGGIQEDGTLQIKGELVKTIKSPKTGEAY